jgi:hypothetical protein
MRNRAPGGRTTTRYPAYVARAKPSRNYPKRSSLAADLLVANGVAGEGEQVEIVLEE